MEDQITFPLIEPVFCVRRYVAALEESIG